MNRPTPYDTGKVKIGLFYDPPQQNHMTPEAERLQSALLRSGQRIPDWRTQEWRLILKDTAMFMAFCGVLFAMMYAPQLFALFTGE